MYKYSVFLYNITALCIDFPTFYTYLKKKFKKICNLLLIITNKCLYLPINNSNAMRKQDKIIQMLKDEESKLWVALKNSELVFGREHEATKMARARWSTTLEILTKIQNDNI